MSLFQKNKVLFIISVFFVSTGCLNTKESSKFEVLELKFTSYIDNKEGCTLPRLFFVIKFSSLNKGKLNLPIMNSSCQLLNKSSLNWLCDGDRLPLALKINPNSKESDVEHLTFTSMFPLERFNLKTNDDFYSSCYESNFVIEFVNNGDTLIIPKSETFSVSYIQDGKEISKEDSSLFNAFPSEPPRVEKPHKKKIYKVDTVRANRVRSFLESK